VSRRERTLFHADPFTFHEPPKASQGFAAFMNGAQASLNRFESSGKFRRFVEGGKTSR
jgi:hypothetical protein